MGGVKAGGAVAGFNFPMSETGGIQNFNASQSEMMNTGRSTKRKGKKKSKGQKNKQEKAKKRDEDDYDNIGEDEEY